jgi:hypothetical protein
MEDYFLLQWMVAVSMRLPRGPRWDHARLNWDDHVEQLLHEGKFAREYRMSLPACEELISLLAPTLQHVEWNSRGREPIRVEHIVALGLRALGGGRLQDLRHVIGSSLSAAYQAFDDFVNAINTSPDFDINSPNLTKSGKRSMMDLLQKVVMGSCRDVSVQLMSTSSGYKLQARVRLAMLSPIIPDTTNHMG